MVPASSATVNGLYVESYEPGRAGAETVLFSAGLGGSGHYWKPQVEAFAEHYRVVLYDHRGTGRSTRSLTSPTSVEAMAADMVGILDALDVERAHIVGHAAGGVAGLSLALHHHERLGRLVAVNSWSRPDPHFSRCFAARAALLKACGPAAYIAAQPIFLYPADWSSEHSAELDAEGAAALAHFPSTETMLARIEALRAFDIDDRLHKITAPVLVSAAADDMLVPPLCSHHLAAALPKATLSVVPWGGHAFTVIAAEAFNAAVLAFLRGDDLA